MNNGDLNVFVSWSKEQAGAIAPHLKAFLEDVLGRANVFLSHDIDSGRRWSNEIAEALQKCAAGVLIVTSENKHAPWLHFEAGAVSKDIDSSNVIPLLWDLPVGDIRETPLSQFQAKTFAKGDIADVCKTLGALIGIEEIAVQRRFETNWSSFENALKRVGSPRASAERAPSIADAIALIEAMSARFEGLEQHVRALRPGVPSGMFGARPNALLEVATMNALAGRPTAGTDPTSASLDLRSAIEEYLRQTNARNKPNESADENPSKKK